MNQDLERSYQNKEERKLPVFGYPLHFTPFNLFNSHKSISPHHVNLINNKIVSYRVQENFPWLLT